MDYPKGSVAATIEDRAGAVSDIYNEVDRLKMVIDRAELNLSHILAPEYDSSEKMASSTPAQVQSFIKETHQGLTYQIERLIRILDRVDV